MTPEDCIRAVCGPFGVTVGDVVGPSRTRRYVWPRHAAALMARRHTLASFGVIGRALGRDHTSAMNSERRARALIASSGAFRDAFDASTSDLLGVSDLLPMWRFYGPQVVKVFIDAPQSCLYRDE